MSAIEATVMPRYYFNVYDGHTDIDTEGSELAGLTDARQQAIRLAADYLFAEADSGSIPAEWHMEVLDGAKSLLFTLTFGLQETQGLEFDSAMPVAEGESP